MRFITFGLLLLAVPLLAQGAAISERPASVGLSIRQDEPGVCRPAEYCHALSPCYKGICYCNPTLSPCKKHPPSASLEHDY
ncbi:hypothetical protein BCV69DRAFT_283142 [Microstroma glucosiphilum]|uniref:Uncharacterized protein n=1 Tax=Pseudomicrostroma glucosiphilum TaxID=1684307 RepID=A0A316U4U5_9BASI|nr:hypothetical protein BCV69DRAFT_283142 [Pseudomicrostroma glucosiphilum]PWN20267.1 hypothetical protein BCV69DRAFT_283142 [Pseudomicrostroma glucosiphilum]